MRHTSEPCRPITTQTDIARLAGVSQKTVHLALHGSSGVNPATAKKIRALASRHGYRLNAAASAMRSQSTRHIGLAVRPPPHGPLTHLAAYETILGADAALADAGYLSSLIRLTDISPDSNSRVFNEVLLDGIIVIDQLPKTLRKPIEGIVKHCVWTETDVWKPTHCIRRDEIWAGALVVDQLARHNIQSMLWVGWAPTTDGDVVRDHYSYPLRLKGIREAATRTGIVLTELSEPRKDEETMLGDLKRLLAHPSTAVVTYNSPTAMLLMNRLAKMGLVAGTDYSLASCDGTRRDDVYMPELTRVTFDRHALGEAAGRMMLASIQGRAGDCVSQMVRGEWVAGATLLPRHRNQAVPARAIRSRKRTASDTATDPQ